MQARCHLLNERLLLANRQTEKAKVARETAEKFFQEADLLCAVCQKPMGLQPDALQILTCTHLFHQRYWSIQSRER